MTEKNQHNQEDIKQTKPEGTHHPVPFQKNTKPTISDGYGRDESNCGDLIEFYVDLNGDMVSNVTCRIRGCENTLTSARAAGTLIKGQTVQEAMKLASPEKINELAQLPEPNKHCADLASNAMKAALTDAVIGSREPWRKLYRKS